MLLKRVLTLFIEETKKMKQKVFSEKVDIFQIII